MIKNFVLICLSLIILSTATGGIIAAKTARVDQNLFTVLIDPGHGGIDPGVMTSDGVKESDLNLYLSKALSDYFYAHGVNCVLTRKADIGLYGVYSPGFKQRDLESRVKIAKDIKADIFISVHMNNYSDGSRRGAQVFYRADLKNSKILAGYIQESLNSMKQAVRSCSMLAGDYYILNNLNIPAVIVECGFLSNEEEKELLLSKSYRESLAQSIFYGVVNFMNDNGQK